MRTALRQKLKSEIIRLAGPDGKCRATATVLPALGANLISFIVDGVEFIYWNEAAFLADRSFSGAFNMFPTPCRLAGCAYTFEGREIRQRKHGKDVFIHGLVRDESMKGLNTGEGITCRLDIGPEHPVFEGFPFRCSLLITHSLGEVRRPDSARAETTVSLTVSFSLENTDERNIPCGYGIHPYWRLHGRRCDVAIRIPCDHVMELRELVPTGSVIPVAGTALDLRTPKPLENLDLDNIFWKRSAGDDAEIIFQTLGKKIRISAGAEFTHMIAYTPPDKEFFCVESLTTSPNAQNIAATDKEEAAHMLVVPPGGKVGGWVAYSVEPIHD